MNVYSFALLNSPSLGRLKWCLQGAWDTKFKPVRLKLNSNIVCVDPFNYIYYLLIGQAYTSASRDSSRAPDATIKKAHV